MGKEHFKFHHHEDSPSFQENVSQHVAHLAIEIEHFGNYFPVDDSLELIQFDVKNAMGYYKMVLFVTTIKQIVRKN